MERNHVWMLQVIFTPINRPEHGRLVHGTVDTDARRTGVCFAQCARRILGIREKRTTSADAPPTSIRAIERIHHKPAKRFPT
eukprot:scaffold1784_cov116-Cylindrotheca_fusiformis.AAC.14